MHIGIFERRRQEHFEHEVLRHVPAAFNFARWLMQDANDAEDAVQEATLKALKGFAGYRGRDARPWFLAIVRNTCMNHIRSKNRKIEFEIDDPEVLGTVPSPLPNPELEVERRFESATLQAAIESLPATWREVLILREFEQLSYAELSEVTAVPIGTVMSRLSRARERLRVVLCEEQK